MRRRSAVLEVVTIVGARPQFIKAAIVSRHLRKESRLRETLIHSGQHYDRNMSQVFFAELEIPEPHRNLGVGSGPQGSQTARMLEGIESLLLELRPDGVLIYGDTNSTLAGVLAATKLGIPTAHVEAGLRSYRRDMPEEINRVVADHLSDVLFAPTVTAERNLSSEGIAAARVQVVGDVMYDAAIYFGAKADRESNILKRYGLQQGGYVLATTHRAENVDNPSRLRSIFEGLAETARKIPVVCPLHPRARKALQREGLLNGLSGRMLMIEPVSYLEMLRLEKGARLIATDSGGVQKEAFFCGVPCVTLRDETEWTELVELGWNRLVSPLSAAAVRDCTLEWLGRPGASGSPYGDGHAVEKIVEALLSRWAQRRVI